MGIEGIYLLFYILLFHNNPKKAMNDSYLRGIYLNYRFIFTIVIEFPCCRNFVKSSSHGALA